MTETQATIYPYSRITSLPFKMNSGRFAMEMIYRYAAPWLLALSACAITGIVLGITIDIRWFIIGLMIVFVIFPMLLAFMYYYFGLRREAFVNTLPHRITILKDGIDVILEFGEDTEPRSEFFPFSGMSPVKTGLNSASISLDAPAKGFIWIPISAFENDDSFIAAIRTIDYGIHCAKGLTPPFDAVVK